eukprot:TRINITY_DN5063_c0_g1_i1.p1 TRINITY_DN5063_c0_g1~~TRINITY_DN5063_c0_g1_i1.p1  ORF type:complete len:108 (+),score=24.95 TRINITY_DN5063_c0_g1_i1:200-523(+)
MALFVFEDYTKSPDTDLLTNKQRQKIAGELNAAILDSQCLDKDPKVNTVLKMIFWAQKQLEKKGVSFPLLKNLETAELEVSHLSSTKEDIFNDQILDMMHAEESDES